MGMKASNTETGIVTMGMMAEGMCQEEQDDEADNDY
jgi:hypothetical protein